MFVWALFSVYENRMTHCLSRLIYYVHTAKPTQNKADLVFSLFSGWMADKTNSYHAAFFFAGGIKVVGVVILVVFNFWGRRDLTQEKNQIDQGIEIHL